MASSSSPSPSDRTVTSSSSSFVPPLDPPLSLLDNSQQDELENFSTQLTELPSASSSSFSLKPSNKLRNPKNSSKKDQLPGAGGNVSKRALALLGNIKQQPSIKKPESKPQMSQISLRRSHSLPNDPSHHPPPSYPSHLSTPISHQPSDENENSYPSTIASESNLDFHSKTTKTTPKLSGFKKFQQIVQTANQSLKKSSLPPEYTSQRRLYNETSNSASEVPLKTSSHQPDPACLTTPTTQTSLPGGLFSVCIRPNPSPPSPEREFVPEPTQSLADDTEHVSSWKNLSPIHGSSSYLMHSEELQPLPQPATESQASTRVIQEPREEILDPPCEEISELPCEEVPELRDAIALQNSSLQEFELPPQDVPLHSHLLDPEDYVLSSMCFGLDERLSSCTATFCGSYILAASTNGTIRLYELLKSGNTDLDDRKGYILGQISSSLNLQSVRVHTQCCGGVITTSSPYHSSSSSSPSIVLKPSHVFIGVRLGSTDFYVVDTLSVTRSRKKRGFLIMTDSQIQIFQRNDTRLRGFCSAIPIQMDPIHCKLNRRNEDCLLNYDHLTDVGYRCKYHLLCGAAYGKYTVWEVVFCATPSCTCLNGDPHHHEVVFNYTEEWNIIHQGSTNGPSLVNGFLFSHYPPFEWSSWFSTPGTLPLSFASTTRDEDLLVEMISQGLTKDARITQVTSAPQVASSEIENDEARTSSQLQLLEDSFDDSRSSFHESITQQNPQAEKNYSATSQTVTPLRGINNIHATSSDGMILFTGLDELVIYR
jgi:hypothetical protein